jgi:hypothetical protein
MPRDATAGGTIPLELRIIFLYISSVVPGGAGGPVVMSSLSPACRHQARRSPRRAAPWQAAPALAIPAVPVLSEPRAPALAAPAAAIPAGALSETRRATPINPLIAEIPQRHRRQGRGFPGVAPDRAEPDSARLRRTQRLSAPLNGVEPDLSVPPHPAHLSETRTRCSLGHACNGAGSGWRVFSAPAASAGLPMQPASAAPPSWLGRKIPRQPSASPVADKA